MPDDDYFDDGEDNLEDDFVDEDPYDRDEEGEELIDGVGFADPGGRSALRAATTNNPRDRPCPRCGAENVLTRLDVYRRYVCDACADRAEGRGY